MEFNGTALTIDGCTIIGNIQSGCCNTGGGVGIIASSPSVIAITNSTISGNSTTGFGGGLYAGALGSASSAITITNCTIFGNTAGDFGAGIVVDSGVTVTIKNTVVAGNTAGTASDVSVGGETFTSQGYNLFGTAVTGSVATDITLADPAAHGVDATLAYNPASATVQTHKLLAGSPAIDAVGAGGNGAPASDQVGQGRFDFIAGGDTVDIGAFELQVAVVLLPETVPTLTEWGIIGLTLILALAAVFRVRRLTGHAA